MSPRKKQLYVLLAVASWITLVIAWALLPIHYQEGESDTFPAIPAGYVSLDVEWIKSNLLVYSFPAILFGGVLFWWFGKLHCNYGGTINPNLAKSCRACGQMIGPGRAHSDSPTSSASTLSVPPSFAPVSKSPSQMSLGNEVEDHAKTYAAMGDNELIQVADLTLTESARKALNFELRKRHLMNQSRTESTRYKGVGGWLALLIFALIFVSPVSLLIQTVRGFQNAAFTSSPVSFLTPALLGTGLACFSIYAGILLWRVTPNAVTVAKRFLMTGLTVHLFLALIAAIIAFSSKEWGEPLADAVGIAFRPLIFVGIWYSYLKRSKRVAATYGHVAAGK